MFVGANSEHFLPNELQRQILGHLDLKNQIAVSRVCQLWNFLPHTFPNQAVFRYEFNKNKICLVSCSDQRIVEENSEEWKIIKHFKQNRGYLIRLTARIEKGYIISDVVKVVELMKLHMVNRLEILTDKKDQLLLLTDELKSNKSVKDVVVLQILSAEWAEVLKINDVITNFFVNVGQISDEVMKHFAEGLKTNGSITWLGCFHTLISPTGVKYFSEALKINSSISEIFLYANKIDDEGVKYLADALEINTSISSLNIADNRIGDDGAKSLASVLKTNNSLRNLVLSCNNIGDDGAIQLAESLKINRSITKVVLGSNPIGKKVIDHMVEVMLGKGEVIFW